MNKTISFKTSGLSGDIIHYLAGIKKVCEDQNAKALIYVWLNQDGFIYEGAEHPYKGKMMNEYAFNMMKPLAESQSYVESFMPWTGEDIQVDLDKIREVKINMPYGSLSRWIFYKYPDMTAPLHEPWLHFQPKRDHSRLRNAIFINRTSRYRNPWISYFFLERYKDHLYFVGLKEEHEAFQNEWKFELTYIQVTDFADLAQAIYYECAFFIGNQSMCFAIAEALKVPRILEICQFAPNVIPTGPGAHDFTSQEALIYFVDKLTK